MGNELITAKLDVCFGIHITAIMHVVNKIFMFAQAVSWRERKIVIANNVINTYTYTTTNNHTIMDTYDDISR